MNILIVTSSISQGGITQFAVNLANYLAENNIVTLAYTTIDNQSAYKKISEKIRCVSYCAASQKKMMLSVIRHGWIIHALKIKFRNHKKVSPIKSIQRIQYARAEQTQLPIELKKHFDIAISTAEFFCNNLVAMNIEADKKIAWIHPDYKALKTDVEFDRKLLETFDAVAVVSKTNCNNMKEMLPSIKDRIVHIPNLMDFRNIEELAKEKPAEYGQTKGIRIITVCRLDNSSKRVDRIVEICRCLKEKKVEFQWYVVGDGGDRRKIEELIKKRNVQSCLTLLGGKENPYPYIKFADVFILTSQYEGRPIAVDEALILGCPVIVTNYASAKEQVDPRWGAIVENDDKKCIDEMVQLLSSNKIVKWKEKIIDCDLENDIIKEFKNSISKYVL